MWISHHTINDAIIVQYLNRERAGTEITNTAHDEQRKLHNQDRRLIVQKMEDRWKLQSRKWVSKGVFATVELMGGNDIFSSFSTKEQTEIWEAIFKRKGEAITAGSLGTCHRYLDVDNIFNGKASPRRDTWKMRFQ